MEKKTRRGTVAPSNLGRESDPSTIKQIEEPIIDAIVITREEYLGGILKLLEERRGIQRKFEYIGGGRVTLTLRAAAQRNRARFLRQAESVSRGYASLDYHLSGHRVSPMVKLDVLVAGEPVDALSMIVHRDFAFDRGKDLISRLRKLIPRQMFEVALQAAIGNKIVARETISAMRKNVLAKCYGGDISRKRKLLEKQKEGKKTYEARRQRRNPPGSLPGSSQSRPERRRRLGQRPSFYDGATEDHGDYTENFNLVSSVKSSCPPRLRGKRKPPRTLLQAPRRDSLC